MVKKILVDSYAICANGHTWRGPKDEVSRNSKMDIANIYSFFKEYIKENGNGARLKEMHFIFDEGI